MVNNDIASFYTEKLILVDKKDNIVGYENRHKCHENNGILHRAFSIFIFNKKGQVLLQKRSNNKILWPLTWSTSCCSHPLQGETIEMASQRRLKEELGFKTPLKFMFKFQYQVNYLDKGTESEICYVLSGRYDDPINFNNQEIAEISFLDQPALSKLIKNRSDIFTPWLKLEWRKMRNLFNIKNYIEI